MNWSFFKSPLPTGVILLGVGVLDDFELFLDTAAYETEEDEFDSDDPDDEE